MKCKFFLSFITFDNLSAFKFLCVKLLANKLITLNNIHEIIKDFINLSIKLKSIYDTIL